MKIEKLDRPWGAAGFHVELTRVQKGEQGSDISTIKHPKGVWFETTVFNLMDGGSVEPLVTETREQAERVHDFAVKVIAQALEIQR